MTPTDVQGFDRTLHETHAWLNDVADAIGDPRRAMAYHALRGVLFALRDRLPLGEVFDLSAQLPMLVRGLFFEGYTPQGKPEKMDRAAFLDRVGRELQAAGGGNAERATRAVFGVLARHVAAGEIEDVRHSLPSALRDLFPESAAHMVAGTRSTEKVPSVPVSELDASEPDASRRETSALEPVDESSRESFPASDAPSWWTRDRHASASSPRPPRRR